MIDRRRLLIVDDDESVTFTLKAVLDQNGCRVETANSILQANTLIDAEPFDVALVDLRLGEEDGIDFLRILRDRQPDCAAIMLTGFASLESAIAAIRLGAYDYVIKPCDIEELKLAIAGAAERGAMARALRVQLEKQKAANASIRSRNRKLRQKLEKVASEMDQKIQDLSRTKRRLRQPSDGAKGTAK